LKNDTLLEILNLNLSIDNKILLNDISLSLHKNEVLGIIGESGSGKSLTALSILRLLDEQIKMTGSIIYQGSDLVKLSDLEMKKIRGSQISIIFQDPKSSLNPLMSIGKQISESIYFNKGLSWKDSKEFAIELLRKVEIENPCNRYDDYPHTFSGGMLQRVMIAIAISSSPKILIADEATTALDRVVERSIIDLLLRFKEEYNLSLIFISHDLRLVSRYANRIAVYKKGKILEIENTSRLIEKPKHSYTKTLFKISRFMNKKNTKNELNSV